MLVPGGTASATELTALDDAGTANRTGSTNPSQAAGASSWFGSNLFSDTDQAISGNPGAVNVRSGAGLLSSLTGLDKLGIYFGGLWIGNGDYLFTGGVDPRSWNFNSVLILDLQIDAAQSIGIPGGKFGVSYLRFDGQPSNTAAGVVTGYDGLTQAPPLHRDELYQLWWRQSLFHDRLIIRTGKTVPTYDFDNVAKPVPVRETTLSIPAVTGLIYTPIFVNPTILGNMPGYYNSAYGITTTIVPIKSLYFSYGVYDGVLARGEQTGLNVTPRFSGYYFQIGEAGFEWILSPQRMPGNIGIGGWGQTGTLSAGAGSRRIHESGAEGFYTFGAQRLWFRNPSVDTAGFRVTTSSALTIPGQCLRTDILVSA
jgi:porin